MKFALYPGTVCTTMVCTPLMTPAKKESSEPFVAAARSGSNDAAMFDYDTVDCDRDPQAVDAHDSGHAPGRNDRVSYDDSFLLEERRLRTFDQYNWQPFHGWPSNHRVTPENLAEAGLYYTGNGDMVRCAFCRGGLSQWQQSDDPKAEHERLFPTCPFRGSTTAGNVPLSPPPPVQQAAFSCSADPRYPSFRDVRTRLNTFNQLSPSARQDLPPVTKLAEAGFYRKDSTSEAVTCFWCDGHLRQWRSDEDPWIEHARWFPQCQFVLKMKGRDYVESVRLSFSGTEPPERYDRSETSSDLESMGHDIAPGEERLSGQQQHLHVSPSMEAMAAFRVLEEVYGVTRDQVRSVAREQQQRQISRRDPLSLSELQQVLRMPRGQSTAAEPQPSSASVTEGGNVLSQASDPEALGLMDVEQSSSESPAGVSSYGAEQLLTCRICLVAERQRAFLPCGHYAACDSCAASARVCPICSRSIRGTYQVFLP